MVAGVMTDSRIKDPTLAQQVESDAPEWLRVTMPVTAAAGDAIRALDLAGVTIAAFQHVLSDTAVTLVPFVEAGARVRLAACNPQSTDDAAAAALVASGIEVWAWAGMGEDEFRQGLEWLVSEPADVLSDMGGELIEATLGAGYAPRGALEATTSGLHRLSPLTLTFPVFNWNDVALKNRVHNRHHVGMEVWPVFSSVTGLGIHGRSVLVVGFGPVGRGVALRAMALGASVTVLEQDPVRALEALQHGCRVREPQQAIRSASIVVTATGREGTLGADELLALRPGTIVFNVGHTNREIDGEWLQQHPATPMRRHVTRYDLGTTHLYLLNRGSLLNLAPGVMRKTEELFDPFSAMMLRGIAWVLAGGADELPGGVHPYPEHLEHAIADAMLAARF